MSPLLCAESPHLCCFESPRLLLRPWQKSDVPAFAALNADPQVMRYFPAPLSRGESDNLAARIQEKMHTQGWGLWAVSVKGGAPFIGFVGLNVPAADLPCSPCVEIGWRLALAHHGRGYASEAATAVLRQGFEHLHLPEIVSFTAACNRPSRRVMEKIGMQRSAEDFDHPALPPDSPLRRHVLYKIQREQFATLCALGKNQG